MNGSDTATHTSKVTETFEIKMENRLNGLLINIKKIKRPKGIELSMNDIQRYMAYNIISFSQFIELAGYKSFSSLNQILHKLTIVRPFSSIRRKGTKFIVLDDNAIDILLKRIK